MAGINECRAAAQSNVKKWPQEAAIGSGPKKHEAETRSETFLEHEAVRMTQHAAANKKRAFGSTP